MINKFQRMMLADADSAFQDARYSLFKASIYLEKVEHKAFKKTINEIKKAIIDLHNSSSEIVDFMNEQDFPNVNKSVSIRDVH